MAQTDSIGAEPASDRGGRPTYHHGDLRRALIGGSLELIAEQGPSSLSLREVARRAGVSHAAPYRHFDDKEALLAAVAEEGHRLLLQALKRRVRRVDATDVLAQLAQIGTGYVAFAVRNPEYFRAMFGPEPSDPSRHPGLQAASESTFDLLLDHVESAQAAELLRPDPPLSQALTFWCQMHGLAHLLVDRRLRRKGIRTGQGASLAEEQMRVLIDAARPE